ncbi:MAG: AIG2-like family protein [Lentisphaerae bacterium ADurb.Bin082]|nr:MAG: AIG2-like family protein [Lentisphaerae bacterium ADurb.Bin082]
MQKKLIRLAVYGTLMTGERNERWGADARRRVPCTIRGVLYDTGWGFPAFVPDANGRDVAAELLEVTPETRARLGCPGRLSKALQARNGGRYAGRRERGEGDGVCDAEAAGGGEGGGEWGLAQTPEEIS